MSKSHAILQYKLGEHTVKVLTDKSRLYSIVLDDKIIADWLYSLGEAIKVYRSAIAKLRYS